MSDQTSTDTISIYEVLGNPALKEAFKWHNVSLYAPENLMFIDKIDQAWRALFLRKHEPHETVALARHIWDTFFTEEAQWEVSLNTPEYVRLKQLIGDADVDKGLEQSLFDRAYDLVVRDMSRSLANFQTTPFWKAYLQEKNLVEQLFQSTQKRVRRSRSSSIEGSAGGRFADGSSEAPVTTRERSESMGRSRSESVGDESSDSFDVETMSRAEVLARVRALYRTTQQVRLHKVPNKDYYQCLVNDQVRGSACSEKGTFYFRDLEGKILLNVPVDVIFAPDSNEAAVERRAGLRRRLSSPNITTRLRRSDSSGSDMQPSSDPSKGLRRTQTNGKLDRKSKDSKSVKAQRRASSGVPIVRKPISFHFKSAEGLLVGPMSSSHAKILWKYHLLDGALEVSSDAGLSWEKLDESLFFAGEPQIRSIDPTSVMKNF